MKTFLHVGCGPKHKDRTTQGFNASQWNEKRLDIYGAMVAAMRRAHSYYDFWVLITLQPLALAHFPT